MYIYIRTLRLALFIVVFPFYTNGDGEFRVQGFLIVEDPFVTVRCRTAIKALFLYLNICLNVILSHVHLNPYAFLLMHIIF